MVILRSPSGTVSPIGTYGRCQSAADAAIMGRLTRITAPVIGRVVQAEATEGQRAWGGKKFRVGGPHVCLEVAQLPPLSTCWLIMNLLLRIKEPPNGDTRKRATAAERAIVATMKTPARSSLGCRES